MQSNQFNIPTVRQPYRPSLLASDILAQNTFQCPEHMIQLFESYLQYTQNNPLTEEKMYGSEGLTGNISKMRIPTIQGFAFFIRASVDKIVGYKDKGEDYAEILKWMADTMYAISIEGAAAGLLKSDVIKSKLGLSDKISLDKVERRVIYFDVPSSNRLIEDHTEDVEEDDMEFLSD